MTRIVRIIEPFRIRPSASSSSSRARCDVVENVDVDVVVASRASRAARGRRERARRDRFPSERTVARANGCATTRDGDDGDAGNARGWDGGYRREGTVEVVRESAREERRGRGGWRTSGDGDGGGETRAREFETTSAPEVAEDEKEDEDEDEETFVFPETVRRERGEETRGKKKSAREDARGRRGGGRRRRVAFSVDPWTKRTPDERSRN